MQILREESRATAKENVVQGTVIFLKIKLRFEGRIERTERGIDAESGVGLLNRRVVQSPRTAGRFKHHGTHVANDLRVGQGSLYRLVQRQIPEVGRDVVL